MTAAEAPPCRSTAPMLEGTRRGASKVHLVSGEFGTANICRQGPVAVQHAGGDG